AAEARIQFHVGPGAFLPPPSVTSTVFSLTPRVGPVASEERPLFAAVVRAAFAGRRKMLRRSLAAALDTLALSSAFAEAGVLGTRRAEELSVEDFARLSRTLGRAGVNPQALTGGMAEADEALLAAPDDSGSDGA
ncbi:MAG TPA: rRNA adenine N-6-methyltransferase family protein, partial [Polyangia bacterium]